MKNKGERTVVSVNVNPYPAGMLWKLNDNNLEALFPNQYKTTQKQKHQLTYQFNDLFILDSVEGFLKENRNLFGENPVAVVIPPERSMPIDYQYQFKLAEFLFKNGIENSIF